MRYPWVCLAICGVWLATLMVVTSKVVETTAIYTYATATTTVLFFLGFTRN